MGDYLRGYVLKGYGKPLWEGVSPICANQTSHSIAHLAGIPVFAGIHAVSDLSFPTLQGK
jgi:hypothetical protein